MIFMKKQTANVIRMSKLARQSNQLRKVGLNKNKEGSVRKINDKAWVDFIYLNERVRESSGMAWNTQNARFVREQLDKIHVAIKNGTFRFADVFPESSKAAYYTEMELKLYGGKRTPDQVMFKEYATLWYSLLQDSGRIEPRTLWGYKSYINHYLIPFFGDMPFEQFSKTTFDKFISWARKQKYQEKEICNATINKIFVPLKMICKDAAIEYNWGAEFNPFFSFRKLPENDPYDLINPFSIKEQSEIIACLPDHWKPYFKFAFCSGLRQGEQIALKPEDIDWAKKTLQISRAMTRDENGKPMMGKTKNRYSRRTIKLIPVMMDTLMEQKAIYDRFKGEYFFCSANGSQVDRSHLRIRVWAPALKKANIDYREVKQTRHTFATTALSCGENPLWIARVMGHRNTDMIIRVYGKYVENISDKKDGQYLNAFYQVSTGKEN